jgi:hypothetical protein
MKTTAPRDFTGKLLCEACWDTHHRNPREKPKVQVAARGSTQLCQCYCHQDPSKTQAKPKAAKAEQLTIDAPSIFVGKGRSG